MTQDPSVKRPRAFSATGSNKIPVTAKAGSQCQALSSSPARPTAESAQEPSPQVAEIREEDQRDKKAEATREAEPEKKVQQEIQTGQEDVDYEPDSSSPDDGRTE